MRPAHPLALVVIGHAALLAAVDLHVGGVQVDGDRALGQGRRPLRGHQVQHPPGHRRQATLNRFPLGGSDPPGQARRSRGRQPRHWRDPLACRVDESPEARIVASGWAKLNACLSGLALSEFNK